ncbi:hypothetical protein B0H67DRAFT_218358 [Lasiosphaeris hirsuta]|uniref:Uncharacterized protein n=1 Tax=Lasiosphaeris hirsuta TaxID=260670 RepID=A0AA40AF37_9PEZI|nr:hypothetical protein B0H67DRAFT_218358 [Lasiosphaeris hirsuta]
MASNTFSADLASNVSKLSIRTAALKGAPTSKIHQTKAPVADSWEDEDLSSHSEADDDDSDDSRHSESNKRGSQDQNQDQQISRSGSQGGTFAPPPTPMSPPYGSQRTFPSAVVTAPFGLPLDTGSDLPLTGLVEKPRPEKTDAVARRMIASALGVKVPKQTEEQRAYDRAIREKERRRREEERENKKREEEATAKLKQAVWED